MEYKITYDTYLNHSEDDFKIAFCKVIYSKLENEAFKLTKNKEFIKKYIKKELFEWDRKNGYNFDSYYIISNNNRNVSLVPLDYFFKTMLYFKFVIYVKDLY